MFSAFLFCGLGSSPRVWGQEFCGRIKVADKGIIPTRMGTSCGMPYNYSPKRDHPHAYGDKSQALRCKIPLPGSSPRVWGQEL